MKSFMLLKTLVGVALIAGSAPTLARSGARMNELKDAREVSRPDRRDGRVGAVYLKTAKVAQGW